MIINSNNYEWEYQYDDRSKKVLLNSIRPTASEYWLLLKVNHYNDYIYRSDVLYLHNENDKFIIFFDTTNTTSFCDVYFSFYGDDDEYWQFNSFVEAKDQIELFINKFDKLKAFL